MGIIQKEKQYKIITDNIEIVKSYGITINGNYNAIVDTNKGIRSRGRSELLVINGNKVYLSKSKKGLCGNYDVPGGSWDKNETHNKSAIREAEEEARLKTKNVKYGSRYLTYYDEPHEWVQNNVPKEYQWRGYYTEVYVGEYAGKYNGKIDDKDKDDIIDTGKFYNIEDVFNELHPIHQKAITDYLSNYSNMPSVSEKDPFHETYYGKVFDIEESNRSAIAEYARSDIKSKYLEKGDTCYNLDKLNPNGENFLYIIGMSGAGKTTLGISLRKELNCSRIELDYVCAYYLEKARDENRYESLKNKLSAECSNAVEFLDANIPGDDYQCRKSWKDTIDIAKDFMDWFESKYKGDGNLYIINGAQLPLIYSTEYFYNKPLIIKDINYIKTVARRVYREMDWDGSLIDKIISACGKLKTGLSKGYRDENRDLKKYRNDLNKNAGVVESSNESVITEKYSYFGKGGKKINGILNESYIFSKNDLYINYEKFESGECNICLITGLSGSGKSTLAGEIAKKNKAEWIELDIFEHCREFTDDQLKQAGQVFYDYLSSHKDVWEGIKKDTIKGKDLAKEINKFINYCIPWCRKDKSKKYIIEGVQIYSCADFDEVKSYPLVIKNTSMLKSIVQRWKRNGDGKIDLLAELRNEFPQMVAWYKDEEKLLNNFRKSIVRESNTPDIASQKNEISSEVQNETFEIINEEVRTHEREGANNSTIWEPLNKCITNVSKELPKGYKISSNGDWDDILLDIEATGSKSVKESFGIMYESKNREEYNSSHKRKSQNGNFKFFDIQGNKNEFEYYAKNDIGSKKNSKFIYDNYVGEILVDMDKEKFAGYVLVKKDGKDKGFIQPLWLFEGYRGYGFGTKLLKDAVNKYNAVGLTVDVDNKVAIEMYKKNGFVIVGYGNKKNNSDYCMKLKSKLAKDDKPFDESVVQEAIKLPITLYHGSVMLYDELKSTGIDLGNAIQKPGWSLFCWTKYDYATGWGVFGVLKKLAKNYDDINVLCCGNSHIPYITKSSYEKLINVLQSIPDSLKTYYVYTIKPDKKYEYGFGHSSNTPNCITIRNCSIKPYKVDKRVLSINDLQKYCKIVPDDYEPTKDDNGFDKRILSFLMTNDYTRNFKNKKQLSDDIEKGLLQVGDDIQEYMDRNGIELNKVSIYDRFKNESVVQEAARSKLPESEFGVPSKRKFPLDSAQHVKSAIRFFNYVEQEDEAELAKRIKKKAKEFGVPIRCGKKNRLSKYISKEYVNEFMAASAIGNGAYAVINGSIKQAAYQNGFQYTEDDEYPYTKKKKAKIHKNNMMKNDFTEE